MGSRFMGCCLGRAASARLRRDSLCELHTMLTKNLLIPNDTTSDYQLQLKHEDVTQGLCSKTCFDPLPAQEEWEA